MRFLVIFSLIFLSACATTTGLRPVALQDYQFRLGAGDVVTVDIYQEENLSKNYSISSDGVIAFPLLGNVQAKGLTLAELKARLIEALSAKVLKDPQVNVSIAEYRPVYILGEVQNPGEYVYSEHMSVMALIAKSGGFTFRANENIVAIRHENEAQERTYTLTPDAAVAPGDVIRIDRAVF